MCLKSKELGVGIKAGALLCVLGASQSIQWMDVRGTAKHPPVHGTALLKHRTTWIIKASLYEHYTKMSIVPRLRNPVPGQNCNWMRAIKRETKKKGICSSNSAPRCLLLLGEMRVFYSTLMECFPQMVGTNMECYILLVGQLKKDMLLVQ